MTSPRRLLAEGTQFERDVLASADLDAGSPRGLKRTLVAIGFSAAAASTAVSTASAGMAAGTSAGSVATGALAGAGAGVLVKWVGLTLVVAGVVTAASLASTGGPRGTVASQAAMPAVRPPPPHAAVSQSPPSEPTTLDSAGMQVARSAPMPNRSAFAGHTKPRSSDFAASPGPEPAAGPPAPVASSALDAEVAALERVRTALERGDAPRALQLLGFYDRAFPKPVLADEATVLRVDALSRCGERAAAAALSRGFIASNPSSPHIPHLRRLIDAAHNQ